MKSVPADYYGQESSDTVQITIPKWIAVTVMDYHEFAILESNLQLLNPKFQVTELGYQRGEGPVGIASIGKIPSRELKRLKKEWGLE